jgi:transketolase C-terminal domain/subunit
VLYPSDAVSAERLTAAGVRAPGIVYIRTTRPKTAVIYDNDDEFPIGGSKTLRASPGDRVAIIAASGLGDAVAASVGSIAPVHHLGCRVRASKMNYLNDTTYRVTRSRLRRSH